MTQWYYANANNERQGPVEANAIRDKLGSGEISQSTLVWCEGMAQWQPLSAVAAQLDTAPGVSGPPDITGTPQTPAPVGSAPQSPYAAPASTLSVGDGAVISGSGEIVYAGFWRRMAAHLIDGMVIGGVSAVLLLLMIPIFGVSAFALFGTQGQHAQVNAVEALAAGMGVAQVLFQLAIWGLTFGYYAWFHASRHMATLGKMLVGIKVVSLEGERITTARSIGRVFGYWLSYLTVWIGFLMTGFTARKQGLHDQVCNTLVVDKWAFTDRPELQQKGLGTATIVILAIWGVLLVGIIVLLMLAAAVGIMAAANS